MKGGMEAVSIDGSWAGDGVAPLFNSREYFAMMNSLAPDGSNGCGYFRRYDYHQSVLFSSMTIIALSGSVSPTPRAFYIRECPGLAKRKISTAPPSYK
jgi:hypothetical protein